MPTDQLSAFALTLLAISLAAERLVVVAKTAITRLQSPEESDVKSRTGHGAKTRVLSERARRLWVLLIAFLSGWLTAGLLADGVSSVGSYLLALITGHVAIAGKSWPVIVVGVLASGGSAFWAQVVGYASAVKDARLTLSKEGGAVGAGVSRAPGLPHPADLSWEELKRSMNLQARMGEEG